MKRFVPLVLILLLLTVLLSSCENFREGGNTESVSTALVTEFVGTDKEGRVGIDNTEETTTPASVGTDPAATEQSTVSGQTDGSEASWSKSY